jgi:hypothetical protein
MPRLDEDQRNNAIGRLQAGETQTPTALTGRLVLIPASSRRYGLSGVKFYAVQELLLQ